MSLTDSYKQRLKQLSSNPAAPRSSSSGKTIGTGGAKSSLTDSYKQRLAQLSASGQVTGPRPATFSELRQSSSDTFQAARKAREQAKKEREQAVVQQVGVPTFGELRSSSTKMLQNQRAGIQDLRAGNADDTGAQKDDAAEKFSLGKYAAGMVEKGVHQFAGGISSTLSMAEGMLTKPVDYLLAGGKETPLTDSGLFHKWNEDVQENIRQAEEKYAPNAKAGGKILEVADDFGTAVIAAIPQAAVAWMSSGAAAKTGLEVAKKVPGFMSSLRSAVASGSVSSPFLVSLLSTVGNEYDTAKEDGASEMAAYLYALSAGTMNAFVEVSGGIETLPTELQGSRFTVKKWIESMVDEGKEEVVQGIISRAGQNLFYGKNNPLVSVTNQDAVLNPVTAAQEFAGGAVVGGILSGAQGVTANILNGAEGRTVDLPVRGPVDGADSKVQSVKYDSNLQKAVDKAQTVRYDKNVETAEATVLNRGATLYTQLGMGAQKAEAKAAVVQKLIDGKDVTTGELKSLNLSDAKYRAIFTEMTGVVFPEGVKMSDDQRFNLARTAKDVAAAQTEVKKLLAAVLEDTGDNADASVTADTAQTENAPQGVQEAAETAELRDPDNGPADYEHFAQAYRETVKEDAEDAEIRASYEGYLRNAETITTQYGTVTRAEFRAMMRQTENGASLTDEQLNAFFDYVRENEDQGGAPMFNTSEEDAAGLSGDERWAVLAYKSGGSYTLNAKLMAGSELSDYEKLVTRHLDTAVRKLPKYEGRVYRNLSFGDFDGAEENFNAFLAKAVKGTVLELPAYTSTSSSVDGHPIDDPYTVQMVIDVIEGRKLTLGNNFENEILLGRDTRIVVTDVRYDENNIPTLYAQEVVRNGEQRSGAESEAAYGGRTDEDADRTGTAESAGQPQSDAEVLDRREGKGVSDDTNRPNQSGDLEGTDPGAERAGAERPGPDGARTQSPGERRGRGDVRNAGERVQGAPEAEGRVQGEGRELNRVPEGAAEAGEPAEAPSSIAQRFHSWEGAYLYMEDQGLNLTFDVPPNQAQLFGEISVGYLDGGQWVNLGTYDLGADGLAQFKADFSEFLSKSDPGFTTANQISTVKKSFAGVEYDVLADPEKMGFEKAVKDAKRVGMALDVVNDKRSFRKKDGSSVAGMASPDGYILTTRDPKSADHEVMHGYLYADHDFRNKLVRGMDTKGRQEVFKQAKSEVQRRWGPEYERKILDNAENPMLAEFEYNYALENEVLCEARAGSTSLGPMMKQLIPYVQKETAKWEKQWDATEHPNLRLKSNPTTDEIMAYFGMTPGDGEVDGYADFEAYNMPANTDREALAAKFDKVYGEGAAEALFAAADKAFSRASEEARLNPPTAPASQGDGEMTGWVTYGRSVGSAALRFDPYSYLQNEYGAIEQTGRNNARIVDVPKSTNGRDKVSKTTATVMGAKATPEGRLNEIAGAVVDGKLSYYPTTNKIAENKARARIRKIGYKDALAEWTEAVDSGKVNSDLVAMGATLLNNAGNTEEVNGRSYTMLMAKYAQLLRSAGQALQAANIFQKMTPEAKLYTVVRQVEEINSRHDTGLPVSMWMDQVGELLADEIYKRVDVKEPREKVKTVADTVLEDLTKYARELVARESVMGTAATRTELERLQDMFNNRANYEEAWQVAKDRLVDEFGADANMYAALENWINSELTYADKLTKILTDQNEVVMPETLAEEYLAADTDEARDEVMGRILQSIADQIPATFMDKFTALRYTGMLGNLRTNARNVAGNAVMQPVVLAKNTFAGLAEALIQKAGVNIERTNSVLRDKETFKAAKADFENVREVIAGGGKYRDNRTNISQEIRSRQRIFKNAALEGMRKGTSWMLDNKYFGDAAFSSFTYADALARYMAANGTTWSQASEEMKDKARVVAIREAAEATYRDNNAFSEAITQMRFRNPKNNVQKGINLLAEGILPFRKTPANILVRSIEYSPIGLVTSMVQTARTAANKTDLTAADLINSFSKGLTGTGLLLAGMALASTGYLKGKGPEDEKEKALWEMQGHQEYSLEIDGTSYTIDWAAPVSIPLLVGAELHEALLSEGLTVREAASVASAVFDPILEMSMLQGVNDAISNAQTYGDESALVRFVGNALWSYISQPIPTLLGQAERASQNIRMTTYVDKNKDVPDAVQRALGKASAKIPGWDYAQIQYIDAWGRTQKNADSATWNVIEQFVSPGYANSIQETGMEKELIRLKQATGDASVLIRSAPKYFNVGNERKDLTADEYLVYAKTRGQTAFSVVTDITESKAYTGIDDKQKAAAVSKAYDYSNQVAKEQVTNGAAAPDKWVAEAQLDAAEYGIPVSSYLIAYAKTKDLKGISDKNGETVDNSKGLRVLAALYEIPGLTDEQVKRLAEDFDVGKTVRGYSANMVKSKLEAMERKYQ